MLESFRVAALISVTISSLASAADMPQHIAPSVPTPIFVSGNWSGLYVGSQFSWQQQRNSYADIGFGGNAGLGTIATTTYASLVAGIRSGYDYQIGNIVVGGLSDLELGTSALRWRDPSDWGYDQKIGIQGSMRVRTGIAFNAILPYITGGVALAKISTKYCSCPDRESFSNNKVGWTVGSGLEFAFSRNWTVLLEYRYTDFGKVAHIPVNAWTGFLDKHQTSTHALRVGVNYRLGDGSASVVAKY